MLNLISDSKSYSKISVVTPSYNQGQFLEETILSVIGQNYPNLEYIIIDGGSTDNSIEIIKKYERYITYWHSRKDNGQADAINQGMRISTGDVVCWLNSDDVYLPGTLLEIGKRFSGRENECALIYGGAITINQSDGAFWSSYNPSAEFDSQTLTFNDYIVQPSSFWTKRLWNSVGELNENYTYMLDWDWFIRASKVAKFEYIRKFYSICRIHPLHKTSYGGDKRRYEVIDVVNKYSSEYWIRLYTEIDKRYDEFSRIFKLLQKSCLPKRNLFLYVFFPKIMLSVKNRQDIYKVIGMCD